LVSLFSLGAGLEAVLALEMTVAGRANVRITSPEEPRSVVMPQLLLFVCWSLVRRSLKVNIYMCIVLSKVHASHYFHHTEVHNHLITFESLLTELPYQIFPKNEITSLYYKSRMTVTNKYKPQK